MPGKHGIWIARELLIWVMIVLVYGSYFASADKQRKARLLRNGSIEFSPNRIAFLGWPVLVVGLIYATIRQAMHHHGSALNLMVAILMGCTTVGIAFSFPAKIILTSHGLEQVAWLWKNKRIKWVDIAEINTGGQSRTVTIKGSDGTRIVHSRLLPDRPRLLLEVRLHCDSSLPSNFP